MSFVSHHHHVCSTSTPPTPITHRHCTNPSPPTSPTRQTTSQPQSTRRPAHPRIIFFHYKKLSDSKFSPTALGSATAAVGSSATHSYSQQARDRASSEVDLGSIFCVTKRARKDIYVVLSPKNRQIFRRRRGASPQPSGDVREFSSR